jgi:hypothetical protein
MALPMTVRNWRTMMALGETAVVSEQSRLLLDFYR